MRYSEANVTTYSDTDADKCYMVGEYYIIGCKDCKFCDPEAEIGDVWCTYPGQRGVTPDGKCDRKRDK